MGLFSFLNKRSKQMTDDFFGLITFRPYKKLDVDYFVGEVYFKPLDRNVDFFIYAEHTGPTQVQKDFYENIENNYSRLVSQAIPLLQKALKLIDEIKDFNKQFTLVCITIPIINDSSPEWKLEFSTIHDENNYYTVGFIGDNAIGITKSDK